MADARKTLKNLNRRKLPQRKTTRRKQKTVFSLGKHVILPIILIAFLVALWHYRYAMYFFFRQKLHKQYEVSLTQEMRIYDVLTRHDSHLYGIDVSHYQGVINWDKAVKIQDSFPISFVFVRATAGKNLVDRTFHANWKELDEKGIIKGAYHYYRPDENSLQQADNFIKAVRLKKGDLPPVLDIENVPQSQSMESLKTGLRRWLHKVESHYGVRPILYSGEDFYNRYLYNDFSEYTVWIAIYNFFV